MRSPVSRLVSRRTGPRVPVVGRRSPVGDQAAASIDGHVPQAADRLASTRARRAAAARTIRSAGTASPVPKYLSSGVWPRNALTQSEVPGGDCADRGSARDRRGTFDWGVWTMPLACAAGAVDLCVLNRGGDVHEGLTIVRQRVVCAWTMPRKSQEPGFHGRWRRSSGVFCPYSCARTHLGCACRCTRRTRTPRTSGSIRTCQRRHVLRRLSDGPRPP